VGLASAGKIVALTVAVGLAVPAGASAATLYDQLDNAGGTATSSYYYPSPLEDVQTADDFTVPSGQLWQLTSAQAPGPVGTYDFRLTLFADAGGSPGGQLFQTQGMNAGNSFPLGGAPQLQAGHYWISIQLMNLAVWQWRDRTVQSGSPAMLQNPDGGDVPSCITWKPRTQCPPEPSTEPDQLFSLSGDAVPAPPAKKKCKKHKKKHKRSAESAKKKKCKKKKRK
jgi:hypothetical protein